MAGASSGLFFGLSDTQMQPQGSSQPQNSLAAPGAAAPPRKKKRNPPGNPKPALEVIALSPQTLMATNQFVCEVCHKGFQRDQNLQLHLRKHNLRWQLKQKNPRDSRRRVYVCPEPTCVHHDPSRALGDLTGIKKHYCRKHGEKTLKCNKCNKLYAVKSDLKAHTKICGTREYRCDDYGSLFSREDSFIKHSTYCDRAPHESPQLSPMGADLHVGSGSMSLGLSGGDAQDFSEDGEYSQGGQGSSLLHGKQPFHGLMQFPEQPGSSNANGNLLNLGYFPGNSGGSAGGAPSPAQDFSEEGENFQGGQGSSLLCGKQPFHALMQLPQQQHQPGCINDHGNLLNFGFYPGNSGGSFGEQDARLVIQDKYNGGGGGSNANDNLLNLGFYPANSGSLAGGEDARHVIQGQYYNGSSGGSNAEQGGVMAPIGSHHSGGFRYQYNSSPSAGSALNSSMALLMKAAQMGLASSARNGPSALLRAAGISAASNQGTSRDAEERTSHAAHFHDLIMNSLPRGGGGFSDGGAAGFGAMDDGTLSTRDFLGIGMDAMAPPGRHIGALGPGQDEGRYDGSFRQ